ncbi:hypothetical protein VIGAN_10182400, partial [Vigna angularis var. angularis]
MNPYANLAHFQVVTRVPHAPPPLSSMPSLCNKSFNTSPPLPAHISMGQSPSTAAPPAPDINRQQISQLHSSSDPDFDADHTIRLSDDCLAVIFHFLSNADRKEC